MANIIHLRVDSKLVDAQALTHWINTKGVKKIIVIDDEAAKDSMIKTALTASLRGVAKIAIYSFDKAKAKYDEDQFGKDKVILVAKNIDNAKRVYDEIVQFKEINLVRLPGEPDQKPIAERLSINEKNLEDIKAFADRGLNVISGRLSQGYVLSLEDIEKTYNA